MSHLIALVVAIAISGFVILGGTIYIEFSTFDKIRIKNEILADYTTLTNGRTMYMEHTDLQLTVLNWETEVLDYIFLPNDIDDLTWTFNRNVTGDYFCLTGNIDITELYESIEEFGEQLGQNSYFINTNCGSTTNFATIPNFELAPQVSATFYVR